MTPEVKKRIEDINNGVVPEGYKKTKVGIIPSKWENYKLRDISEEITEKAGSKAYETVSISAGIGFVNQADKFGKELSGKQYEKYIVLHKGDFSYNKGNSKKYPQGCIYQLKDRESAAVPNVFESFRFTKGSNDYYEQLFVSGFLNEQLFAKINHGVRDDGLLNLKGDDFYSCYVPFPTPYEQQKIASILTTQDKLITLQEQKVESLMKLKKTYLEKMFPKKGSKYPEYRFKGFTDAWEQRKLGDVAKFRQGIQVDLENQYTENADGRIRFIRIVDYTQGTDDIRYIDEVESANHVDSDDVVVVRYGATAGFVGHGITGIIANNMFTINPSDSVNKGFLYTFMKQEKMYESLNSSNGSSAMPAINFGIMTNIEISYPTIEEQIQIGDYFIKLDNLITLHQRKLEAEKKKKKALMQLLLTGKVRV